MSDAATAAGFTPTEIMTVTAARKLQNGQVCFVGIGMPSAAANLARITHAPEVVLIYESGTIGAPAALMSAVLDALRPLGVTDLDMPFTPEKIWRAIRQARG